MDVFGPYLDAYIAELSEGGMSPSSASNVRKFVRAFLTRCPPRSPSEITAEVMADVSVTMENDSMREPYIRSCLIHTGRFLKFITGLNPYNGIDPSSKEDWFVGHMGEFLFGDQLEAYLDSLRLNGLTEESLRRKRIHAVICCRILTKEKDILFLSQVDEPCYWYLESLMKDLCKPVRDKILFDFDSFVKFCCQESLLRKFRKRRFPVKEFENTPEWQEFMRLAEAYREDMEERGMRPRSVSGTMYSIIEGYQLICTRFGPVPPKDVDYHHIRELRKTMKGLKQRTMRIYLGRLGKMLEFHFGINPYEKANLLWSPETVERTWIFKDQWRVLWSSADATERLVLALAGGMGLRRFEIAGLKLSDIHGSSVTLGGKGSGPYGKVVEKAIPAPVQRCISEYLAVRESIIDEYGDFSQGNLLVMDRKRAGAPATTRFVETVLQRLCQRTRITMTCHTLRRYYCMALVDAGIDMDTVRRMMRHESIETTFNCYVYADPRKIDAATAAVEDAVFA